MIVTNSGASRKEIMTATATNGYKFQSLAVGSYQIEVNMVLPPSTVGSPGVTRLRGV